jgi:hypothetical protein
MIQMYVLLHVIPKGKASSPCLSPRRKELLAKLGLVYPLGHLTLLHSSLGKSGQAISLRHVRQHFHKKFRVLRKNGDMRMYFDGIGQWWSEASAELGREVEKKPTAMEDYLSGRCS